MLTRATLNNYMISPPAPTRAQKIRKYSALGLLGVFLALLGAAAVPNFAHAAGFLGIFDDVPAMISDMLRSAAESMIKATAVAIDKSTLGSVFGGDGGFATLIEGNTSVYNLINAANNTIIALATSILCIVMLVQLIKVSQRMDGQAAIPAVKDIIFLFVFVVIFQFLINHAFDICNMIFNEVGNIGRGIHESKAIPDNPITFPEFGGAQSDDVGMWIGVLLVSFLLFIVVGVAGNVIAWFSIIARAIQLYIMAAFSPIPLALLGLDETRSMGVGFLKNFFALSLAGAIIIILVMIYPALMMSVVDSTTPFFGENAQLLPLNIIKMFAVALVFMFGLLKSGSWARDIVGG